MPPPGQMAPLLWHGSGSRDLMYSANGEGDVKSGRGRCTQHLCMLSLQSEHLKCKTLCHLCGQAKSGQGVEYKGAIHIQADFPPEGSKMGKCRICWQCLGRVTAYPSSGCLGACTPPYGCTGPAQCPMGRELCPRLSALLAPVCDAWRLIGCPMALAGLHCPVHASCLTTRKAMAVFGSACWPRIIGIGYRMEVGSTDIIR